MNIKAIISTLVLATSVTAFGASESLTTWSEQSVQSVKDYSEKMKDVSEQLADSEFWQAIEGSGRAQWEASQDVYDVTIKPIGDGSVAIVTAVYVNAIEPAGKWVSETTGQAWDLSTRTSENVWNWYSDTASYKKVVKPTLQFVVTNSGRAWEASKISAVFIKESTSTTVEISIQEVKASGNQLSEGELVDASTTFIKIPVTASVAGYNAGLSSVNGSK